MSVMGDAVNKYCISTRSMLVIYRAEFGVVPRNAGPEIQNSAYSKLSPLESYITAPYRTLCVTRPIEHTCQVSLTSAQRSRSLENVDTARKDAQTDGRAFDEFHRSSRLFKS